MANRLTVFPPFQKLHVLSRPLMHILLLQQKAAEGAMYKWRRIEFTVSTAT
jgi:hypothetical protein